MDNDNHDDDDDDTEAHVSSVKMHLHFQAVGERDGKPVIRANFEGHPFTIGFGHSEEEAGQALLGHLFALLKAMGFPTDMLQGASAAEISDNIPDDVEGKLREKLDTEIQRIFRKEKPN